jgi:glutamate-1-semialdehyde 2,1-aminomutase
LILGSAYPTVVKSVRDAARRGLSYGAATKQETDLAERIQRAMPSIELMRLVSSGTEAAMSVVRVARAFTKKNKIIKFDGCYHGHSDGFLVRGGSGLATFSLSDSAGIPPSATGETLVAKFNDLDSVENLFEHNKSRVAGVIVEPVAGNMGVVPPEQGYLEGLRKICEENDSLLIFDEVITGFRVARGGAQSLFDVRPDLTCLGKIIGGGMNIAAYGGRKDVMQLVSPLGPVYQAGTLAGNPVAVAAGISTLDALVEKLYSKLNEMSEKLSSGIAKVAIENCVDVRLQRVGSMLGLFFYSDSAQKEPIRNYDDVKNFCSKEKYSLFFGEMIDRGIYLPPSAFETIFISAAHSATDVDRTISSADDALRTLRQ